MVIAVEFKSDDQDPGIHAEAGIYDSRSPSDLLEEPANRISSVAPRIRSSHMSDTQEPMKRVTDVVSLCLDDFVEARIRNGPTIYYGEVESVDFRHGFLWIRHGALKERKLLDASEYEMWWRPT